MREYHILNLGAGVQSTTLYLMSLRRDEPEHVPAFDYAIFADTQEEPRAVYEHLEWLRSLGGPPILVDTQGKLGDDLIAGRNSTGGKFYSIPAFTARIEGQKEGITRRQCTKEYKADVVERVIRRQILGLAPGRRVPPDVRVHQYFGLSFDEPGRVFRVGNIVRATSWAVPHFPLFDLEMTRRGCRAYLEAAAPGREVPRSACVFCPYKSDAEWRDLRDNDREGWERAVEVDEAIRTEGAACAQGLERKLYLHSTCRPLKDAPIDTPESRGEQKLLFGFDAECEGMCGV